VQKKAGVWKVRPDQKLVVMGEWSTPAQRLNAAERILNELANLARSAK
jgi:transcription-repair coupling factor (superfamily II helicase)